MTVRDEVPWRSPSPAALDNASRTMAVEAPDTAAISMVVVSVPSMAATATTRRSSGESRARASPVLRPRESTTLPSRAFRLSAIRGRGDVTLPLERNRLADTGREAAKASRSAARCATDP